MVRGFGMFTNELIQLLVRLHFNAWADFTTAIRIQRRLLHDFAGEADAIPELLPVLLGGHVVEKNARVFPRILGLDLHATTAGRTHRADVSLETMLLDALGTVVIDRHRQEVILDVRPFELRARTDKTARLELVAGADASTVEQPLGTDGRLVVQQQRRIQRHRLGAGVLQVHLQVILQILANARQVVDHRDVEAFEQCRRADAGALQHLRRGDGAAAQQHFLACSGLNRGIAVAHQISHAHRTFALEQDAIGECVGDDGQGRTLLGDVQVTARGAGATAFRRNRAVHRAEAFLLVTVEVVGARVTGLHAGFDHGAEQRVVAGLGRGHADRAIATVEVVGTDVTGFGFFEVRQAVGVRPVFEAGQLGPAVVVHGVAADIAHAVDQRRPTQALAAPAFHATVVHVWLGIGLVSPVVATALQWKGQGGRHLGTKIQAVVRAAGFEQQYGDASVFGQARGQGVTGRAGTNDDVIEFLGHGVFPL